MALLAQKIDAIPLRPSMTKPRDKPTVWFWADLIGTVALCGTVFALIALLWRKSFANGNPDDIPVSITLTLGGLAAAGAIAAYIGLRRKRRSNR